MGDVSGFVASIGQGPLTSDRDKNKIEIDCWTDEQEGQEQEKKKGKKGNERKEGK